ncbi:MAG: alpha/beta hydrolase [Betaproteobacteria bacterium]|nr:alpha/beta hydrolase [Betaproteobacteria bacterium]
MHYVIEGGGAPALVLVHGFACDHQDWRAQLDHFAPRHAVLACDLRGHGATPGGPDECSIEHYAGDVAALLGALEIPRAVLVGHSLGCRVVLEAARLDPERVAGVVLIDGSRMGRDDPAQAESAMRAAIEFAGYAAFVEALFAQMFFQPSAQARAIVARARRLPAKTGSALFPRLLRWDAAELESALDALRAPLLVIQTTWINEQKKRAPLEAGQSTPWLELVKARVPGARIEIIPDTGHFAQIEAADEVNRMIDGFLGSG